MSWSLKRKAHGLLAAEQGTILTRQLMTVSRRPFLQPQVLEFRGIIDKITPILRRTLGEDIELHTTMAPTLGQVNSDPGQLEQVILNLAVNARDAMPQGGLLTVEATQVELQPSLPDQQASIVPGRYIKLVVSDTGTGIDAETQTHIFERGLLVEDAELAPAGAPHTFYVRHGDLFAAACWAASAGAALFALRGRRRGERS